MTNACPCFNKIKDTYGPKTFLATKSVTNDGFGNQRRLWYKMTDLVAKSVILYLKLIFIKNIVLMMAAVLVSVRTTEYPAHQHCCPGHHPHWHMSTDGVETRYWILKYTVKTMHINAYN